MACKGQAFGADSGLAGSRWLIAILQPMRSRRVPEVWMELAALGDAVWLDPIATDVLPVCYETMLRAKTNIEILVGALDADGYGFPPPCTHPTGDAHKKCRNGARPAAHERLIKVGVASRT
jgi:hypothetical protein